MKGMAHTLLASLLFCLILVGFMAASDLRSATTPRSVRRALVANGCFHMLVVFTALAIYFVLVHNLLILLVTLGVYVPLQAALLLRLWRSPAARESNKNVEFLSS